MASSPNPLQAAMVQQLMARIGGGGGGSPASPGAMALGGGAPPGGPAAAGPSGAPGDAAANAGFSRDLSSLRQADPMAMAKAIQDIRQKVASMISSSGLSIPGVGRSLAKTLQGFDSAIKEAQTAAATMTMASPIQASAAQGAPGMGGGAPAPGPSMGGM